MARIAGIIEGFAVASMDSERINLIDSTIADLRKRIADLRRYL